MAVPWVWLFYIMTRMGKRGLGPATWIVLAMLGSAGCASLGGGSTGPGKASADAPGWVSEVTITRDEWGVPYIDASTDAAAAAGLAYAMAEDGFRELEESYARALGIAAAYHGESMVASDQLRMRLRTTQSAHRSFAGEPAEAVRVYKAFADGLNYFLRVHPEIAPRHISRYDGWMVLAFANEIAEVRPIEDALLNRILPARARERTNTAPDEDLAWIVRTADGRPLLLSSFSGPRPYEMNVHTADGWRFHGFGTLGSAIPGNGYSAHIAFAKFDGEALGAVRAIAADARMVLRSDSLRVNTRDGVVTRRVQTSQAEAGPVVASVGDTALVVAEADAMNRGAWTRWRGMARARDTASFAAALRSVATGSRRGGTTLFVDAAGAAAKYEGSGTRSDVSTGSVASGARSLIAGTGAREGAWTLQKFARAAFDRRVHSAEAEIAALADEWEQVGARNPERALAMDTAIAMLRAWDLQSTINSPTMTLYAAYFDEYRAGFSSTLARFSALERVVLDRRRFPPQPWGSVNALRRSGRTSVPVAGAPARLGIMFAYEAASGMESFVWAVDLGGGEASSVRSFGQGMEPSSAHWFDQAILFAAGSLKAAPVAGPVMGAAGERVPYHPGERR